MSKTAIVPAEMQALHENWRMSPGIKVDGLVFLTGFSGAPLDGDPSADPAAQIETAFDQVNLVLREGGMTFADVVEVTSYHVGLREHLETFKDIWRRHVRAPYPAWTAIEVAGFATEGVIVELRVIARMPD